MATKKVPWVFLANPQKREVQVDTLDEYITNSRVAFSSSTADTWYPMGTANEEGARMRAEAIKNHLEKGQHAK